MIAKGNLHGHGAKLAAYLTTEKDDERAELAELRGFETPEQTRTDLHEAFGEAELDAEATHCEKPFFHCYVRLPESERLSREQWFKCAGRLEKALGFTDQPRAVVFHHQADGDAHMHIVWSRIDLENECAINPGLYKNKLKETCRALEQELDLTRVKSEREAADKTLAAGRNEFEAARRLKTDLKELRETIRACWDSSLDGRSFAAALAEKALILARGDRRDLVVINSKGGLHALGKRLTGATMKEVRGRLADLDRAALPSVEQVRAWFEPGRGGTPAGACHTPRETPIRRPFLALPPARRVLNFLLPGPAA